MGFGSSKSNSNQQSQSSSTQTSNSSSQSGNQAYDYLSSTLNPTVATGVNAGNAIANLLGVNGTAAQDTGFDNFKDSSGYDFARDQGVEGITTNAAAKGLLGSGSTLKAITSYSSNLAQQFLSKYLDSLTGLQSSGSTAANTIAGAGQYSNSQSSSTGTSNSSSTGVSSGKSTNFTTG